MDSRQQRLLEGLVDTEARLREESRPLDFILLQMPGPAFGLKPGIEGEAEILPSEGDLHDLAADGLIHLLEHQAPSVVARFALTGSGRAAGHRRMIDADLQNPAQDSPPPSPDALLAWLHGLSTSSGGATVLKSGGALMNQALDLYGKAALESVARSMIDLRDDGFVRFDDPGAMLDQIPESERIAMAGEIRLTSSAMDRINAGTRNAQSITQIVHATNAQVAAGNISNYVSFSELLDSLEDALDDLAGVDDEVREEARGLLAGLRSATGKITVGVTTSTAAALIGGLLQQKLGLR
jgi:hypothetical protein